MSQLEEHYFENDTQWRKWLHDNHDRSEGIYLIFYKVDHARPSMRWEEAVRVALCYGWIDSTVKSLGNGKRRQYFCRRKPKSVWSKVNKTHLIELEKEGLIHKSGYRSIAVAKENGSWSDLDDVENGLIPDELQHTFDAHPKAFENFQMFAPGYRKSYLYWLHQAKRPETRKKRIEEIIALCAANIKSRTTR
ncbi:MAG: YdeI/OmpD-associated family protein [Flavobacteriaceae bacterium]|nr:YdeI/OmpD-associated family protein [Flavobacteriaceae bacterium]